MALLPLPCIDETRLNLIESAGFSLEQLLELDGIACAMAIAEYYPSSHLKNKVVLVFIEDGYSGGVGLTCARHLRQRGYYPMICFPRRYTYELLKKLKQQCVYVGIPFIEQNYPKTLILESIADLFVNTTQFFFSGTSPEIVTFRESCTIPIISIGCVPREWYTMEKPAGYARPDLLISLIYPNIDAHLFKGSYHCLVGNYFTAETLNLFKPSHVDLQDIPEFTNGSYFVKLNTNKVPR